jgi:hypothetical protein
LYASTAGRCRNGASLAIVRSNSKPTSGLDEVFVRWLPQAGMNVLVTYRTQSAAAERTVADGGNTSRRRGGGAGRPVAGGGGQQRLRSTRA